MGDYKDLGFDSNLFKVDSLSNLNNNFVTNTQFDANYEGFSAVKMPDSFKVVKEGTLSLSGTNNTSDYTIGTVTHNLGAPPAIIAYSILSFGGSNQYTQLPLVADTSSELTINIGGGTTVVAGLSASSLYYVTGVNSALFVFNGAAISAGSYGGAGVPWSYNIKYYLLRESAK